MFAAYGFQLTRARQMVKQYPWAYEPAGPFWWRPQTALSARAGVTFPTFRMNMRFGARRCTLKPGAFELITKGPP